MATTIVEKVTSDSYNFWYGSGIYAVRHETRYAPSEFNTKAGSACSNGAYDKKIYVLPEMPLSKIDSAYSGKPGSCMCGCSGKYSYPRINQVAAGKVRGYPVGDEEVSDRRVQNIINKVRLHQSEGIEVIKDHIFTIVIGERQYSIYLFEEEK